MAKLSARGTPSPSPRAPDVKSYALVTQFFLITITFRACFWQQLITARPNIRAPQLFVWPAFIGFKAIPYNDMRLAGVADHEGEMRSVAIGSALAATQSTLGLRSG